MGRSIGCLTVGLLILVVLVPAILVRGCDFRVRDDGGAEPLGLVNIKVYDVASGRVLEMDLEKYVEGVVAGEMPALFHPEALKAQAIAARTYAVRKMRRFGGSGDDRELAADISNDPARDQAWVAEDSLKERWGFVNYYRYRSKIAAAVQATAGLILTYQGEPITPAYHSTCGGRTENSEDVWTYEVPYLRSVTCTTDAHSPHYQTVTKVPLTTFVAKVGPAGLAAKIPAAELAKSLTVAAKSSTGRVKQVKVGDKFYRGLEFRSLLGLPSTHLTWQLNGDTLEFTARGYGHGVGMCQYGADGMAKQGKKVAEILEHYFTGAKVSEMFGE